MQSPSRRAFLHGRHLSRTPWGQFCQRLRRTVAGEFTEFDAGHSAGMARLTLYESSAIHHVLALCREYGVVMALDGLALPARFAERPTVWVRPGPGMAQFQQLEGSGNHWFVQPGCTAGELVQAGFAPFSALAPDTSVAAWIADRTLSDYATGRTGASGIKHMRLLLSDGTGVTLGPFGERDSRALEGRRAQQLVSDLFRVAARDDVKAMATGEFWPLRYRLDALMKADGAPINLAHLVLGHGGDLGWVDWVVLDASRLDPSAGLDVRYTPEALDDRGWTAGADALDIQVRQLFDPAGVFPPGGQAL